MPSSLSYKGDPEKVKDIDWLKANKKELFKEFAQLCLVKLMGGQLIEQWAKDNDCYYEGKGKEMFDASLAKVQIQKRLEEIIKYARTNRAYSPS